MLNNIQMQQRPSIPFVSGGYGNQSIRNPTKELAPSVPLQQQSQRYLHSLGYSTNRCGVSGKILPNASRQNKNHISFMDELNSDNTEYQQFLYLFFVKFWFLKKLMSS